MSLSCQPSASPATLTLYSDWHFCSSCGLPRTNKIKLSVCRRCKTVAYHNAECQKSHWKRGHKRECALLAKAIQPLLEIRDCWQELNATKIENRTSWWDLDRLDPQGSKQSSNIWQVSEVQWNRHREYLEAMTGFQRALEPVARLWRKRTKANNTKRDKRNSFVYSTNSGDGDGSGLGVSNLSLQESSKNGHKNEDAFSAALVAKGLTLAQKLLFCAYCEADGDQIQSSRMRLAQCTSILLERARISGNLNSETKFASISSLLRDAWMELMLSYEEEASEQVRRISRHVVHMAIQSSLGNTLYGCDWKHPLQRPGYMGQLLLEEDESAEIMAPPYIPPQDHPAWCQTLQSHWKEIASELHSLQTNNNNNNNQWTVVGSGDRGSGGDDHRVVSAGGNWTEHVLFGTGSSNSDMDAPFTKSLLRKCVPDAVSLAEQGGGEVIFSKLAPKTKIAAHCGPTNLRWTAHLGLVIPSTNCGGECSMRVANKWHHWQTGKVLLFDDSYEHEIRNDTNQVRIVLLLRLWHPSLPKYRRQDELNKALLLKQQAVEKRYKAPSA